MNNELTNLTVVILTHKTNKNTLENCLSSIDPKVKIILIETLNLVQMISKWYLQQV